MTPTSSVRAKVQENAFDDSSSQEGILQGDKEKDEVLRENLESSAQPEELAKFPPGGGMVPGGGGGMVVPIGGGPGQVAAAGGRASPAGVIPNAAALHAVNNAHEDAQLEKGLHPGLLNSQGSTFDLGSGGADFEDGDTVMVTDQVAADNPWAAGKEGTVKEHADGQIYVTFTLGPQNDRSAWFKSSQLKQDEDLPPLEGDFKVGEKVMVTAKMVGRNGDNARFAGTGTGKDGRKEGTVAQVLADGKMMVTFTLGPQDDRSGVFDPSQLEPFQRK